MKLRKIQNSDLKERVSWMNDIRVYPTMNFTPPISLERTEQWFANVVDSPKRVDLAFTSDNGELLAFGGLTNIDYSVRKAEFYIFVNPERHKQGIGTMATTLLCDYGFNVLELHKIYLFTNSTNIGGRKTYEKVGFKLEGVHRDEKIIDGKYIDRLYFGLISDEFSISSELIFIG